MTDRLAHYLGNGNDGSNQNQLLIGDVIRDVTRVSNFSRLAAWPVSVATSFKLQPFNTIYNIPST